MARGWDLGNRYGTKRIECANPPGTGVGVGVVDTEEGTILPPEAFRPNVFCGLVPWDASPPEVALGIGIGNFSYEFWFHWKIHRFTAPMSFNSQTGLTLTIGGAGSTNRSWVENNWNALEIKLTYFADEANPLSVPRETLDVPVPDGWHHIAANCNRVGNMTLYVDGIARDAVVCDAVPFGAAQFHALVVNTLLPAQYNGTLDDLTTYGQIRYVVGRTALHTRLMSAAELQDSYRGRRVQNFGTPNTIVCWDWRQIEGVDSWDFDSDNTHHGIAVGLAGIVGLPRGAAGTIRVPDLSGAGNDWVLPTLETYQRTVALDELSSTGFLADPFWSN